jgi:SAM-dependent methyltransferase
MTAQEALTAYKWYHRIDLGDGLVTPGWPDVLALQDHFAKQVAALDLRGKRVLDIGCRDGLFSFQAERAGAAEVIGIDNDLSRGAVEFLIPHFASKVRMHQMNVLDLKPESFGEFDVVLFPGVLYHLRYPMWALKLIRDVMKVGAWLLTETAVVHAWPQHAALWCPVGKESPYEGTSCTFFNMKGFIDTAQSLGIMTSLCSLLTKGEPQENHIYRAVFVSQHTGMDPALREYWDGAHSSHN